MAMFRRSDGFADSQLSPIPASPNRSSSIVHQEMTFDLGQSTKLPFRSNISAISRPPTALQNSQIGSSSRFGDMRSRGQSASSDNETNLLLKASRTQKDINTQRQKQDQWQQHGKYELFSTDNRHVLGTPDSSLYSKANSSGAGGSVFQGRKVVGGALSNRPVRPSKLRNEHHISQRGSEINPHFVAAGENTSPSLPSSVGTPMRARPRAPIQPPITGLKDSDLSTTSPTLHFPQSTHLNDDNRYILSSISEEKEYGTPEKHTSTSPTDTRMEKDDLDSICVTVFGFSDEDAGRVATEFGSFGAIIRKAHGQGNWMHLQYASRNEANRALNRSGQIIGGRLMIGVKRCTDSEFLSNCTTSTEETSPGTCRVLGTPIRKRPARTLATKPIGENGNPTKKPAVTPASSSILSAFRDYLFS
eukprot:gene5971-7331_t